MVLSVWEVVKIVPCILCQDYLNYDSATVLKCPVSIVEYM